MNNIDLRLEEKRVRVQQLTLEMLPYPAHDYKLIADAIGHIPVIRKSIIPMIDELVDRSDAQPDPGYVRYRQELESLSREFTNCMSHLHHCHQRIIDMAMHAPGGFGHNLSPLARTLQEEVSHLKPLEDVLLLNEAKTLTTRVSKLASSQKELRELQSEITEAERMPAE